VNAGYVKIGTTNTGDTWQQRTNGATPSIRFAHSAVWTGSEMIIWGGVGTFSINFNDTFSYSPGKVMYLYQRP